MGKRKSERWVRPDLSLQTHRMLEANISSPPLRRAQEYYRSAVRRREAAASIEVVRSKSMLAQEGFRMICEDIVHHGVHVEPRKASRLIDAAYEELGSGREG